MTLPMIAGFEQDILEQPDALASFASRPLPAGIASLDLTQFDRIIMTGMGSSDYVTIPLELLLARQGMPIWRLQTSRLLETLEMITDRTLLWITSQSGRSGEVVALLDRLSAGHRGIVVAVTNDPESPLARAADHVIELHCGKEATVSSKSYLNTLAVIHRFCARVEGRTDEAAVNDIRTLASDLRTAIEAAPRIISVVAERALAASNPRFALIGSGPDAATALTGALILKEASKVAAEGYIGGAFRHGPLELAGPGLTAFLFGSGTDEDLTLRQLVQDLSRTGSNVIAISPRNYDGAEHIAIPSHPVCSRMAHAMIAVQQLSVSLARQAGFVPGEFRYGQKITALL
jgi:glucosamine--fructose-6-phosphate aminotransferase (isomerizing)